MANLKGKTFERQIQTAFFKILKYGEGRHNQSDNFTHSIELAKKRQMYLNDFKRFLEQKGITKGKLNTFITKDNVIEFIEQRTAHLSPKSSLDYTTGFNSLIKALEQSKTTIPVRPSKNDFLKSYREQFRAEMRKIKIEKGRYIQNLQQKLNNLKEINYESYVIAKLQAKTGLRISEALEVVKNFSKYYNSKNGTLENIIGKGNHTYMPKKISNSLALEIKKMEDIPTQKAYSKDLKAVRIEKSHNFRVTYAKNSLISKLEKGIEYKQALKEVSEKINHHRPEMTLYYLKRV